MKLKLLIPFAFHCLAIGVLCFMWYYVGKHYAKKNILNETDPSFGGYAILIEQKDGMQITHALLNGKTNIYTNLYPILK